MEQALVVSLNFNPGHTSHLVAVYKQFEELGFLSTFYINESFIPFLPKNSRIKVYGKNDLDYKNISIAFFLFPSQKNILAILKLKLISRDVKVLYMFHEPMESLKIYRNSGFTSTMLLKASFINIINIVIVKLSSIIFLPSKKALTLYDNKSYYLNKKRYYLPLMFDDELTCSLEFDNRKYFSYIGTIAADHSFNEYLQFVEWAILNSKYTSLSFLIATKSSLKVDDRYKKILESDRLEIFEGKPLTNEQINNFYRSTLVVWNAYQRTTQSGVLVKSFMFGTPVLLLSKNKSEFADDGCEAAMIEDNSSEIQIGNALDKILNNYHHYSKNCRKRFLHTFYYRNYNNFISKIISND